MNNRRKVVILGGALLAALVLVAVLATVGNQPTRATPTPAPYTKLNVFGGLMLQDQEVLKYLHDQYQIDVNETMMGSFAQAEADLTGIDCVWPGSASAADYFKVKHPGAALRVETIFQTYIIVYTWDEYLPTLEKAGLVRSVNGAHYLKMRPIIDAMAQGKAWSDLGVNIPGPVNVESTDPLKSSSGLVFLTMMADFLVPGGENGGKVVTADTVGPTLPIINKYWAAQGRQSDSSPALFTKFTRSGAGEPMIINYESSFIDFFTSLPDDQKPQANKMVGLYPEWTVNTDHVLISLTPACNKLVDIFLNDQHLKELAWGKHGMRNGSGGIAARPGDPSISWIATTVQSVAEPKKDVVDAIMATLK